jgi:hypothetical protein
MNAQAIFWQFNLLLFSVLAGRNDDEAVICLTQRTVNHPPPVMETERVVLFEKGKADLQSAESQKREVCETLPKCRSGRGGPPSQRSPLELVMTPVVAESPGAVTAPGAPWGASAPCSLPRAPPV